MLPNFARKVFYSLHSRQGPARFLADMMSWGFMTTVKLTGMKPPQDITPLTIVSHRHKFVYIGIPKIATRSFRTLFYDENIEKFQCEIFETRAAFLNVLQENKDYYKFSFVRNPYARILSCYNSKIGHHDLSLLKRARIMSFYKGLKPGMSFLEFARWLNTNEGSDVCADRHWMSQHKFLYDENGAPLFDTLGRYEHLHEDLNKILSQIGIEDLELPHKGWISKSESYRQSYNAETRELIAQRYEKDLSTFGFDY